MSFTLIAAMLLGQVPNETLIKQLGSDDFQTREKAHKELHSRMNVELSFKLKNFKDDDQEIMQRMDEMIKEQQAKLLEKHVLNLRGYPRMPWITCWTPGYSDCICAARKTIGLGGEPDWTEWRLATYLYIKPKWDKAIRRAFKRSTCETDFHKNMEDEMIEINGIIRRFIKEEDLWWKARGEPNPLRNKS